MCLSEFEKNYGRKTATEVMDERCTGCYYFYLDEEHGVDHCKLPCGLKCLRPNGVPHIDDQVAKRKTSKSINEKQKIILEHYGEKSQCIKTIEELAELQKEIAKYLNLCPSEAYNTTDMLDEIADVLITVGQLADVFVISKQAITDTMNKKLDRVLVAINKIGD